MNSFSITVEPVAEGITAVNPSFFIGPFAPEWAVLEPNFSALSTNNFIYDLIRRNGPPMLSPAIIDVRDAARALVLSLTAPPTSQVGRKRLLMGGEFWFGSKRAVDYIAQVRPQLKDRLSEAAKASPEETTLNKVNSTRAREILGLEFTDWKTSVVDAVDSLLTVEKEWVARGWVPPE